MISVWLWLGGYWAAGKCWTQGPRPMKNGMMRSKTQSCYAILRFLPRCTRETDIYS